MIKRNQILLSSLILSTSGVALAGGDVDYDRDLMYKYEEARQKEEARQHEEEDDDESFLLEEGFEVTVMVGLASVDQEDGSYQATSDQTNSLIQTEGDELGSWTAQIGVGYRYKLQDEDDEDEIQWFTDLTPQINLYYLDGNDLGGEVYRFEVPELNQTDYTMDFSSTRLMFDLGLTVAAYQEFSVYALAGLGVAWNNNNLETSTDDAYEIHLDDNNTTSFAYEVGAGVGYAITDDWGLSLQYLYADLGDASVQGTSHPVEGDKDDFEIPGSDTDITSQALMLGVTMAL
jgi:opacity protein-like surface antigen